MQETLNPTRIIDCLKQQDDRHAIFYARNTILSVSFGELHHQVIQTVTWACSAGIGPRSLVGVVAENGRAALLIDLALLQIGATAVQLPETSAAETLKLIGENRLNFIVSTEHCRDLVNTRYYAQIATESGLLIHKRLLENPIPDTTLKSAPAIIFSSGTSGRLKKLLVNARGIVYHANVFFSSFETRREDLFLIFLPLSNYQQKLLIYGCILSGIDFCLTDVVNVLGGLRKVKPTLFLAPPIFYETAWKLAQRPTVDDGVESKNRDAAVIKERLQDYFGGKIRIAWSGMAPIPRNILRDFQASGVPLYEAYGMTEYGPITANSPGHNRIGSVGRELVQGSIRLAQDGEIVVRSKYPLTTGYLDEDLREEKQVYVGDDVIVTGDIGYLDEDGFLFLRGRKKEILVTSSGYKVHPQLVEHAFHDIPHVLHTVLMGSGQFHLGLLVIVRQREVETEELISQRIGMLNAGMCRLFPIKKWCIREEEFSPENGMLTRNLKLNRTNVVAKYHAAVFS